MFRRSWSLTELNSWLIISFGLLIVWGKTNSWHPHRNPQCVNDMPAKVFGSFQLANGKMPSRTKGNDHPGASGRAIPVGKVFDLKLGGLKVLLGE
jgi:hypothetical protein